jgi:hypothetical protein
MAVLMRENAEGSRRISKQTGRAGGSVKEGPADHWGAGRRGEWPAAGSWRKRRRGGCVVAKGDFAETNLCRASVAVGASAGGRLWYA